MIITAQITNYAVSTNLSNSTESVTHTFGIKNKLPQTTAQPNPASTKTGPASKDRLFADSLGME